MTERDKLPAAWVDKAEHDRLAIRSLMAGAEVPWDIVAFHAQQAAEKYLKALLVQHEREVPRIHDLERLLQLCGALEPTMSDLATDCRRLTQLGFVSRYPDSPDEPSKADAEEAIRLTDRICSAARERIGAKIQSPPSES